jgi:4'-phosphopantetheinyl transferase EntD
MSLFASLLASCPVSVAETTADASEPLYAEELAAVRNAVDKRRREFTAGRQCARQALRHLGAPAGAIAVLPSRAPAWPAGVIGSITHCAGLVAAAVAHRRDLWGLGIDAEPCDELEADLVPYLCIEEERDWTARHRGEAPWSRIMFSAKESVYKCVSPPTGIFLEFSDVCLQLRRDGTFGATSPLIDLSKVVGRWSMSSTHIATAAFVRSAPSS